MINKIEIRNFQSLSNVLLEPGHFTVIVGESDIGKSAIIRAIESVLINRVGKDFISKDAKRTGIALYFDDGAKIAWIKSDSAEYHLQSDGKTTKFVKIGREVPEEVLSVLKMGIIKVGEESLDINVHNQFDTPFLIMSTPSLRARLLAEPSGINLLYLAIQEARRREQLSKRTQSLRMADLEAIKRNIEKYNFLPKMKDNLDQALSIYKELKQLNLDIGTLKQKLDRFIDLSNQIKISKERIKKLTDVAMKKLEVETATREIKEMKTSLQSLIDLGTSVGSWTSRVHLLQDKLSIEMKKLSEFKVCPTCKQPITDLIRKGLIK